MTTKISHTTSILAVNDMHGGVTDNPAVKNAKLRFGIIGNAPALAEAVARAIRVAPIDLSVLVTGESGSGKEFFPKIIHQNSPRKHAKYIAVNCGAIPEGTIDSELFGHEKGAFTGAVASRKGYFEEADGGTIFLDEVAELPMTTQARLLRVLETGEYLKVGSSVVQSTNIRIVAATNVDLQKAIADGRFREDLYYSLSTVQICVPPLRRRGDDIMLLAGKFAADFAEKYRMPGISFDDNARRLLLTYPWPGNVRQLKNVIEQIALFDAGATITREVLQSYLPDRSNALPVLSGDGGGTHSYASEREMLFNLIFNLRARIDTLTTIIRDSGIGNVDEDGKPTDTHSSHSSHSAALMPLTPAVEITPLSNSIDDEREVITKALRDNNGRRRDAAAQLNISERTLYRKIKEYNLE